MSVGGQAPLEFTIPGTKGDQEFDNYQLSEYTDAGALVLVFYPFDFSPVCITELCEFRDAEWLMVNTDIDVLGISRDACYAHSRFIDEYNLPFPLLSDIEGRVTEAFDVTYEMWELHRGVPKRAVVIVDSDDIIQYAWETEDAYESPDLREIAEKLESLPSTTIDRERIS